MASSLFKPFHAVKADPDELNRLMDLVSRGFDAVSRQLAAGATPVSPVFAVGNGQQVSVTNAPPLVTFWMTSNPADTLDTGISVEVFAGVTVDVGTGYVVVAPKDGQVVLYLSRSSGSGPVYIHADFTNQIRKVTF